MIYDFNMVCRICICQNVLLIWLGECCFLQTIPMFYCRQEYVSGSYMQNLNPFINTIYYSGPPRNISPPWRPDDKDGHYVFAVGDNLTPRCIILSISVVVKRMPVIHIACCFHCGIELIANEFAS
jgi:hypothetical protein